MSFRSWGPKNNPLFVFITNAVASTQTNSATPAGLKNGGNEWRVFNSGASPVIVCPYNAARGAPTLSIPGANASTPGFVVAAGATALISGFLDSDSIATISAGTSITLFVQRGDGQGSV